MTRWQTDRDVTWNHTADDITRTIEAAKSEIARLLAAIAKHRATKQERAARRATAWLEAPEDVELWSVLDDEQ